MKWTKVSKEVIDKAPEIIPLKKGELQVKYAKALVKIDRAIDELNGYCPCDDNKIYERTEKVLSILQDEEVK